MIVPGSVNPLLLQSTGSTAYQITRSLRFSSPSSKFLSRTPASAGNRKTWTWAAWVKRASLGGAQVLFSATDGSTPFTIYLDTDNTVFIGNPSFAWKVSSQVFRDPSAWGHLVVAVDTTQGSNANRAKIYWNGSQISLSTDRDLYNNTDLSINGVFAHNIGRDSSTSSRYFDGYLADCYLIDGQQLDPSSFTTTDATTGQLIPKAFSGSYGSNGWHLDFADNSAATATTLGKDSAGSNNWTPNNFSVTAGAGNDSLVDVPTSSGTDTGVGGEVRGNYCTINATLPYTNVTLLNGNLDVTGTATYRTVAGTIGVSSGKWYWEVLSGAAGVSLDFHVGIGTGSFSTYIGTWAGSTAAGWIYSGYQGNKYNNNSGSAYGATFTSGDIIGVALDADNGTLTFYKNGVSQGQAYSGLTSGPYFPIITVGNSNTGVFNFGARAFSYTAPSGFKALCTTNLPSPLVTKPNTVFDVALWTGTGVARSITGLNFSPDFVWGKDRTGAGNHNLYDIVRGANIELRSNSTMSDRTNTQGLTSFDSNGFSLGTGADSDLNLNGRATVAWCWDAGTSTVTNTQGSITSSVRANPTAGFSVITATTTNTSSQTFGHGLGVAPAFHIIKLRNGIDEWYIYHSSLGATQYLKLNATTAATSSVYMYANTAPTSSVITLGSGWNNTSYNFVCYAFAPVVGYSSMGSYVGNGSSDGVFVFTGMRPRFILVKCTTLSARPWKIFDTSRDPYNGCDHTIYPNASDAETTAPGIRFDLLSNGFKLRTTGDEENGSGQTYIYAAFAESPFQYARAR